jgi:hypothetical protein
LLNGTPHTLNAPLVTTNLANGDYQLNVTVVDNSTTDNTKSDTSTFFTVANVLSDTTPPASVTNLTMTGNGTTWLLINWTNPSDSDFDHVMIFKNSTFVANTTSNTTYSYNITGLNSGTAYEITVKTVDTSGNVNQTGKNLTASTAPNTPASGSPVTVTLQNSTVTFTSVNASGTTIETSTSQTLPSGYTAVGNYMDISTTATYTAPVTVRVKYNPTSIATAGYVESDVRLYHYNASTGQWDNITTAVLSGTDEVEGTVSSLSPFVPGVPPKPSITKVDPNATNIETTGTVSKTFKITVSQAANVTWYVDSVAKNSTSVSAGVETNFTYPPTAARNYNVSVTAAKIGRAHV